MTLVSIPRISHDASGEKNEERKGHFQKFLLNTKIKKIKMGHYKTAEKDHFIVLFLRTGSSWEKCLPWIPDPNFSIPDPGSRVKKEKRNRIPKLGIRNKEFTYRYF